MIFHSITMIFAGSSAVTQSGINNRQANNIIVDNSSLSVTTAIDPKEDSDDEKDSSDEKGNKEVNDFLLHYYTFVYCSFKSSEREGGNIRV